MRRFFNLLAKSKPFANDDVTPDQMRELESSVAGWSNIHMNDPEAVEAYLHSKGPRPRKRPNLDSVALYAALSAAKKNPGVPTIVDGKIITYRPKGRGTSEA
jgi:hypothetical protein